MALESLNSNFQNLYSNFGSVTGKRGVNSEQNTYNGWLEGGAPSTLPQIASVGAVNPFASESLFTKIQDLSIKDGVSPNVEGSALGQRLDIGKNGSIDNQAWGLA